MRTSRAVDVWPVLKDPKTPRTSWSISDVVVTEGSTDPLPDFVDRQVDGNGGSPMWPRSEAFDVLAQRSELRYILHLDDHWS